MTIKEKGHAEATEPREVSLPKQQNRRSLGRAGLPGFKEKRLVSQQNGFGILETAGIEMMIFSPSSRPLTISTSVKLVAPMRMGRTTARPSLTT